MSLTKEMEDSCISLLRHELRAAEGCTEPIAIAYAAALCTKTLGKVPASLEAALSGNIIKNARCAVVPNTGGQKGIKAAAIAGALGGDPDKGLEVLSGLNSKYISQIPDLLLRGYCKISLLNSTEQLHILITAKNGPDTCSVEIKHAHTQVHRIVKNGKIIFNAKDIVQQLDEDALYKSLSLQSILQFAKTVDISLIDDLIEKQIAYNMAICEEGLRYSYGANIGQLLLSAGTGWEARACAYAAAGSDARMSGCPMPVIINSGSGNQGITVTAPVWVYAQHIEACKEKLVRALLISNLVALYQKRLIGKLSAYCGAISAACGSGAALMYLANGNDKQIENAVVNATVTVSGILCDGAKPSCAAKIATSVNAAIMGFKMAMGGNNFLPGDGLVGKTAEQTIASIGQLASEGLIEIDKMMLNMMIDQPDAG